MVRTQRHPPERLRPVNVGELIEKLSTLDPTLPVITDDSEQGWGIITGVHVYAADNGWYDNASRTGEGEQACHLFHD